MEENYKSYALEFLGIGEIIGEIETLLKCKNLATVKTLTDCMLYKIEINFFKKHLINDSNFNRNIYTLNLFRCCSVMIINS